MENSLIVSVIIPVYNGEAYLAEAVESIRKQDYEPIEIIIVDDGSTDKTAIYLHSRFSTVVIWLGGTTSKTI